MNWDQSGTIGKRVSLLRQEFLECRMMPSELVLRTITMLTDAVPELLDFLKKLLTQHLIEIFVHIGPPQVLKAMLPVNYTYTELD